MKKVMLSFVLLSVGIIVNAQSQSEDKKNDEKEKGFKKENLFTGGSIALAFYSGGSTLGASPVFGYRIANWVDAGVVVNYTHDSRRDYPYINDKIRQSIYGAGAFTRIYPVRFLFAQAQFEHNFTSVKYIPSVGTNQQYKTDANSLLVGAGFAQGRQPGSNSFFYFAVLWDVLKLPNSPYVTQVNGGGITSYRANPIIKAGVNIGLFEGGYGRGRYR